MIGMQKFRLLPLFCGLFFSICVSAQVQRPKLVVGIVVDQMRWDYLYRYADRYAANGGFKRMLNQGHTCENTLIPYAPTVTACGHSTIYSGAPPAISGIAGNSWWDKYEQRSVYCTEDKTVNTVGAATISVGRQSPRNLLVSTISDELRLATNFNGKVIGVAIKDRGSILPAGHSANAAYWYDGSTGNFITSTYFMNELPQWVTAFNNKKLVNSYYEKGWSLLYPSNTYIQSTSDNKNYETATLGGRTFPYNLQPYINKDFSKVTTTPMGNSLTLEMAKAALINEQLGQDAVTDLLAISFSSPDLIGHSYGPNSIESEDGFLRLDKELGQLLDFLDSKVGKNQYTVFLSADHGVAHIPEFLNENKIPAQRIKIADITSRLNTMLQNKFGGKKLILSDDNYQMHLNHHLMDSTVINKQAVASFIVEYLNSQPEIYRAFASEDLNTVPLNATIRKMLNNGYHPKRSGDVFYMLHPADMESWSNTGTTHGLWNPYDAHIPLLWYGWGIKQGKTNRETYMTDIAATLAALLKIQMPNGCVGQPITEVLK
jgi:predicted AlkP superfamily pyrophosphatase or phosphodiesterase